MWVSHTHAVSFHERRHSHSQLFGEVLSSQAHVVGQSAILKRVYHMPDFLVLASVVVELEECFSGLFHPQREGLGAFDTVFLKGQGRGKKLVREDPKPVGSGRFRDHAQDPRGILGMSFSSSLASNEASCGHTLTVGHAGEKVALLAQLRLPLETSSISIQPKEISLPCSSFTPFFFRSRNGYPK